MTGIVRRILPLMFTLLALSACKTQITVLYNDSGKAAHVITDDSIMEVFHADDWWQFKYAEVINNVRAAAPAGARVFNILAPTAIEFAKSAKEVSDPQKNSIEHIYGMLNEDIITVDAYSALRKRLKEYVYFRTDNHWTAKGAYYAYSAFCEAAGITAIPLSSYDEHAAPDMRGLFWDTIPEGVVLEPDIMYYYTPKDEAFTASHPLVNHNGWYYGKFLDGGYSDYYNIETSVKNNRTVIIMKDSFAHSFIPFIAPHYERVIVLDPRFLIQSEEGFSIVEEAKQYENVDIIFINYIFAATFHDFVTWMGELI